MESSEAKSARAVPSALAETPAAAPEQAILITDPNGRIEWVNAALERLTGFSAAELVGQTPRIFRSGHHTPEFYTKLWSTIESGQTWHGKLTNRRKDESTYVEEMVITPVRSAAGTIERYVALKSAATGEASPTRVLRAQAELYYDLFESAPVPYLEIDTRAVIRRVNAALCTLLDYTADDLVGHPLTDFAPEHEREAMLSTVRYRTRRSGPFRPVSRKLKRRDSGELTVEMHVRHLVNSDGEVAGLRAVLVDVSERILSEELARETLARYQSLFDGSLDAIAMLEVGGEHHLRVEAVNPRMAAALARNANEVVGRPFDAMIPGGAAATVRQNLEECIASGTASQVEETVNLGDGERRWQAHLIPLRDGTGQMRRLLAIARDVSERYRAEEILAADQRMLKTLFDSMTQAVLYLDLDSTIADANPAAETLMGRTIEQMRGCTIRECGWEGIRENGTVFEPGDNPASEALARGEALRGRVIGLRHRDGGHVTWVNVSAIPRYLPDRAGICGTFVVAEDITEAREAARALELAQEHLLLALEAGQAALWDWDSTNGITYLSPSMHRMMGYEPDELEMSWQALQGLVHPDDLPTLAGSSRRLRQSRGQSFSVEHRLRHKNGDYTWVLTQGRAIRFDDEGNPTRIAGTTADVTARRQINEQLRHLAKMESVGRLAGSVAHDFNNLLTVIGGYAELLWSSIPAGDPLREHIGEIRRAGERAAALTQQLLAFSRKQPAQPRLLSLNGIITESETILRRMLDERIQIDLDLAPALGLVHGDADQLAQLLVNLAMNARDAMPYGGRFAIKTENTELDASTAATMPAARAGRFVHLTVADSGVGMDGATQSRIFEPFFTTKPQGSGAGLGLSTVYGIVQSCEGWLTVESEPGHGARFHIYLPWIDPESNRSPAQPQHSHTEGQGSTILLVEDQDYLRRFAASVLRSNGYTVMEAGCGEDALEMVEQHTGVIDLLLTDIVMPGISGDELVERLRPHRTGTRFMYMSGYTGDEEISRRVTSSGLVFLRKPFTPTQLLQMVRTALGTRR